MVTVDFPASHATHAGDLCRKTAVIYCLDVQTFYDHLHRFYRSQPELNVANPAVRNEIAKIIGCWMELGLSGFLAPAREDPGPIRTALMGRPDRSARRDLTQH